MKKNFTVFTIMLGLGSLLMFSSCSKDGDTGNGGNGGGGNPVRKDFVSAKIDGQSLDTDNSKLKIVYDELSDAIELTAYGKDNIRVLSAFFSLKEGNSLEIGNTAFVSLQYLNDPEESYDGKNGLMVLTKLDKTGSIVEGTFNVTLEKADGATKSITEGSFSLKYK
jgi:hypothetical protein